MEPGVKDTAISAEQYRKTVVGTKLVDLPSGSKFVIRRIDGNILIKNKLSQNLRSLRSIYQRAEADSKNMIEMWDKMSDEEKKLQIELTDRLVVLSTIQPLMSVQSEKDKLQIDELTKEDYATLLKEIMAYSFGGETSEFFRK